MEAQTAFVGADGGRHLHAVAAVYLHLSVVVHPGYAEHHYPLRFDDAFQQTQAGILGIFAQKGLQAVEYFFYGLVEDGLIGIALLDVLEQGV